jgi:hypothetical protein
MSSRRESSFTLKGQDGSRRTFTILSTVTPDDLVRIGLKAYVLEKRVEYESPFSREVRDMLVNSRITQRG